MAAFRFPVGTGIDRWLARAADHWHRNVKVPAQHGPHRGARCPKIQGQLGASRCADMSRRRDLLFVGAQAAMYKTAFGK